MSTPDEYELVVTPPAARAISEQLPEPVAAAVIEFLTPPTASEGRYGGIAQCPARVERRWR